MASLMVVTFILAAVIGIALGLLRNWWDRRSYEGDECEVCEKRSRHNVTLTAERDRSGGGLVGGSSISATFCPEHLPT